MARILIPIMSQQDCEFLSSLGGQLQEKGFSVSYVPRDQYTHTTVERFFDTREVHSEYLTHSPEQDLSDLLDKYDIDNKKSLLFSQMVPENRYTNPTYQFDLSTDSSSLDFESYESILHRTLDFFDTLYENGEGGIVLQHSGGEILRRVAHQVANYHDYESIWVGFSPIDGHSSIYDNELANWGSFDPDATIRPTEDELQRARNYRDSVRNDEPILHHTTGDDSLPSVEQIVNNVKRKLYRIRAYDYQISPITKRWLRAQVGKVERGLRERYAERVYLDESSSQDLLNSTKYVFYPLQFFRESRVTVRAAPYYNQVWLIEYLSRSLPNDYELVVKDHPFQLGRLPIRSMKHIAQFSQAIHPEIHAHKVIEQADAVVTLNNTVGFEALVYGKPVVSLGDAFYDDCGYTFDEENIRELPATIEEAIESDGLNEDEVLEMICRTIRGSYRGKWYNASEENVDNVANSVTEFLTETNNE